MLVAATTPMLKSRAALRVELANLEREVRGPAKDDPVCRLLMTMPGIVSGRDSHVASRSPLMAQNMGCASGSASRRQAGNGRVGAAHWCCS